MTFYVDGRAQVPLMAEVPQTRRKLALHLGDAGVVASWLRFLWSLATDEANQVSSCSFAPIVC